MDLPPPYDIHDLQRLQGLRRKLTGQSDCDLDLRIVMPSEREKFSLLQQMPPFYMNVNEFQMMISTTLLLSVGRSSPTVALV